MRILHLHDETWDSGLAHYAYTLAEALQHKGHEVHFWAKLDSFAATKAKEAGLFTRELSNPWTSLRTLRQAVLSADIQIINAHTGSSHSLAVALAMGRRIAVARTWADARNPQSNLGKRFLIKRTNLLIAANSKIAVQLTNLFPSSRMRLIPPGIPDFLKEIQAAPQQPIIGILGRLDPVKGHDDFIDAAVIISKQFPNAIFLVAGEGQQERFSKLLWQVNFLGLNKKLKFLGRVPDAAGFIDGCSIGVVASRGSEAVSRAAIEWMSRGRPLVATRVGGISDIVAHGETGLLIPPDDPQTMAKAMTGLIADPAFALAAGEKARARFLDRFSLEPFVQSTVDAYAEAI